MSSLDHYLTDHDVVKVMLANCGSLLSPNFATEHFLVACIYFNPLRRDLPENILSQYGFPPFGISLADVNPGGGDNNPIDILDGDN
jgi:hypothetical protein